MLLLCTSYFVVAQARNELVTEVNIIMHSGAIKGSVSRTFPTQYENVGGSECFL